MADLFADERQANIFPVFVAVTDDHRAGHAGMGEYRHQFRFGTGLQAQGLAGVDQRFDNAAVLVDLNWVNQKIAALVAKGIARPLKNGVNGAQAVLQDLREAEQRRQTLAFGLALFYQFHQIDARLGKVRIRANADMTQLIDVVVVIAPVRDIVGSQHFAGVAVVHGYLLH